MQKATLRRIDWRFLLPTPPAGGFRHLLLGDGSNGVGERLLETHFAALVSCEVKDGWRADAAVLLHDSPIAMEQAAATLDEGGVLYQEVARNRLTDLRVTPKHLRRRLQAAGLTLTGVYWAAPNFEQCRRYIPLDVEGAAMWYFSSLFVAGTPLLQLTREFFRLGIGKNAQRLAWFAPSLCITAVASKTVRPPSLLGDPHISQIMPQIMSTDGVRPMLLTSGQDDASRTIMLPFAPHQGAQPQAVIKIATSPVFNEETSQEQDVLRQLHQTLDARIGASVPTPLGSFNYGGQAVAIESCAPGESLWASSGEWGSSRQKRISDLEVGVKWLCDFHRQSQTTRHCWDQYAIWQWIEEPLREYRALREVSKAEEMLFALMVNDAKSLMGTEFPLVWQHHDFAPWNLFRSGNHLTVIDWEGNRSWERTRGGPVLCDLFYFVTYWNNVANRLHTYEAELNGLRALFLTEAKGDPYVMAVRQSIVAYMATLDVDWRFAPLLLAYTWIERVVYSSARSQKLTRSRSQLGAADKFARYVGVLAEQAEELFCVEGKGFWQEGALAQQGEGAR